MRLFFYGTLVAPQTLAACSGTPLRAGRGEKATLHGWKRVALSHSRYSTLRRCRSGVVHGVLAEVSAPAAARIAAHELDAYRLMRVVVHTEKGKRAAGVWIAPGATRRPWKEKNNASTTTRGTWDARGGDRHACLADRS
ncbi:MAG: gamma-glutamylcyclotransferase [Acetobacteraceae bacterium]|nr:gamma-glutamylcyclotransferase [Acetobacteraceae bacterium]